MAVGPEIESIRYDNLPSPVRIGNLATKLVEFAERHDKLSVYGGNLVGETLKQIVKPMQRFESPSLDIPDVYLLQTRTAAHLESQVGGVRRLRVFDSMVRKELGRPGGQGVRSIYDFVWNDDETIDARRRLSTIPQPNQQLPMIDVIDQMMTSGRSPFRDTDAVAVYMTMEIDQLTADDTEQLSQDIDDLIGDIDNARQPYHEPDHHYAGFIARY